MRRDYAEFSILVHQCRQPKLNGIRFSIEWDFMLVEDVVAEATGSYEMRLGIFHWIWRERAWRLYESVREKLREEYYAAGGNSGIPRGVTWATCEWTGETHLLREFSDSSYWLLSGVRISFEAIPGGEMEDVEAVSSLRTATAVFHLQHGRWMPTGRTLFNFEPPAAAQLFSDSHELVRAVTDDKKTVPDNAGDG